MFVLYKKQQHCIKTGRKRYQKGRSHHKNFAEAFLESGEKNHHPSLLVPVKKSPYTLGYRLWSLLPLRKLLAQQNQSLKPGHTTRTLLERFFNGRERGQNFVNAHYRA
jgi:hypothetical protein